jgi:hypothetical protein
MAGLVKLDTPYEALSEMLTRECGENIPLERTITQKYFLRTPF